MKAEVRLGPPEWARAKPRLKALGRRLIDTARGRKSRSRVIPIENERRGTISMLNVTTAARTELLPKLMDTPSPASRLASSLSHRRNLLKNLFRAFALPSLDLLRRVFRMRSR